MSVGVLIFNKQQLTFASSTARGLILGTDANDTSQINYIIEKDKELKTALEPPLPSDRTNPDISTVPVLKQLDYTDENGYTKPLKISKVMIGSRDDPNCICMLQDQSLYRELEKANIAKEYLKTFFAMTTHEFRSPLHGVLGVFETLQSSVECGEMAVQCKMGVNAIKLMMRLVNDILDLSQLETNSFRLSNEDADVKELVHQCMELMQYKYDAKGVGLQYTQIGQLPGVKCDKNRYMQIVINLLSNAIKFTDSGIVSIKVQYDMSSQKLLTEVADTGIGIKEEDKVKLFRVFGKLEDALQQNPQGTGLGLYICRMLAEAMGGTISINSEYLKGTTISFIIQSQCILTSEDAIGNEYDDSIQPLAGYNEIIEAGSHSSSPKLKIGGYEVVLVVDDELICATAVKSHLKCCGYDVDMVNF